MIAGLERLRRAAAGFAPLAPVWLFFFVSGACGLLYQVVWTRKLVLLFGTTAYAVSTVLAVFFIGLAAGSLVGGRWADRTRRPLFLYGLFEVAVGLWALAFIFLIDGAESAVVGILRDWAATRWAGTGARALLAAGFLFVPVFLMGATLPLLARFAGGDSASRGRRIGTLYSVNTLGAVAGCACTGFVILPALGYTRSTLLGVAANVVIGVLALVLGRRPQSYSGAGEDMGAADHADAPADGLAFPRAVVLAAYGVSGFCALAYEVLWTRLLATIFLGTTYAFTAMLSTLLLGIALGSAVGSIFVDRNKRAGMLFGFTQMLVGAAALAMLAVFPYLPKWLGAMQTSSGFDWAAIVRAKLMLSFLVLFPPTFLFGLTFPMVVRAMTQSAGRLGRDVGRLYAFNTFGGVLGAAAGGFVVIPLLGTHQGIVALSVAMAGSGVVVLAAGVRGAGLARLGFAAAGVSVTALAWHLSGTDVTGAINAGYVPKDQTVLFCKEGTEGTVAVSAQTVGDTGTDRTLWINAVQATASIEKGVKMNRFQGVLPLLFDREPRRVLFMCFGSGITAGTLGLHDYERIDAVEISPEVLKAAPLFAKDNLDVVDNPRLRFHVDDGRNYLLRSREHYDVITFEPMPLAIAGVSTFYTQEYYRLCLERLSPYGVVSQWVPLHSLDPALVRALTATFVSVFPEYCAWFVNADMFLIGSKAPLRIDYGRALSRLETPAIKEALVACGLRTVEEVVSCFFMGKDAMRRYAGDAPVMTDDRPWAEFQAPKLIYSRTVDETIEELLPFFESPVPSLAGNPPELGPVLERRHAAKAEVLKGLVEYYGGTFGSTPEKNFKKALEIDPGDLTARFYLKEVVLARATVFAQWEEFDRAVEALTDALKYAPDIPELLLRLGDIHFEHNKLDLARECYTRYAEAGGNAPQARARLDSLLKPTP